MTILAAAKADPIGCSKTIGDAAVKMAVDRLAHIFEVLKNDEECVEIARSTN